MKKRTDTVNTNEFFQQRSWQTLTLLLPVLYVLLGCYSAHGAGLCSRVYLEDPWISRYDSLSAEIAKTTNFQNDYYLGIKISELLDPFIANRPENEIRAFLDRTSNNSPVWRIAFISGTETKINQMILANTILSFGSIRAHGESKGTLLSVMLENLKSHLSKGLDASELYKPTKAPIDHKKWVSTYDQIRPELIASKESPQGETYDRLYQLLEPIFRRADVERRRIILKTLGGSTDVVMNVLGRWPSSMSDRVATETAIRLLLVRLPSDPSQTALVRFLDGLRANELTNESLNALAAAR